MFAAGANLFDYVFGIGYIPALILSVVVVTAYIHSLADLKRFVGQTCFRDCLCLPQ